MSLILIINFLIKNILFYFSIQTESIYIYQKKGKKNHSGLHCNDRRVPNSPTEVVPAGVHHNTAPLTEVVPHVGPIFLPIKTQRYQKTKWPNERYRLSVGERDPWKKTQKIRSLGTNLEAPGAVHSFHVPNSGVLFFELLSSKQARHQPIKARALLFVVFSPWVPQVSREGGRGWEGERSWGFGEWI